MSVNGLKAITPVPNVNDFLDIILSSVQRKTPTVIHKNVSLRLAWTMRNSVEGWMADLAKCLCSDDHSSRSLVSGTVSILLFYISEGMAYRLVVHQTKLED